MLPLLPFRPCGNTPHVPLPFLCDCLWSVLPLRTTSSKMRPSHPPLLSFRTQLQGQTGSERTKEVRAHKLRLPALECYEGRQASFLFFSTASLPWSDSGPGANAHLPKAKALFPDLCLPGLTQGPGKMKPASD